MLHNKHSNIEKKHSCCYNMFIKIGGIFVVLCTVAGALLFESPKAQKITQVSAKVYSRSCIIIDAGHGGFDGGAVAADGTVEKDINLMISEKLAKLMTLNGFEVIMTRKSDTGTDSTNSKIIAKRKKSDMVNRLKVIEENPDAVYIGVHLNKFTTSAASGAQIFYSGNNADSYNLGLSVQNAFSDMLQPENDRVIKKGTNTTYLLYNAKIPAIIVECGFLSNKAELEKLKNDEYQTKLAVCISAGILNYYGGNYGK